MKRNSEKAKELEDEVDPEYRQWLVSAEQKAQEDYDKTILTLSGGALGISFAFIKDILGDNPIIHSTWLVAAWALWALSTSAVLSSFFVSRLALRKAITQCDDRTIFKTSPGGFYTTILRVLNISAAALFFTGVCVMAGFVNSNIQSREAKHDREKTTTSTNASTSKTTTASPGQRRQ